MVLQVMWVMLMTCPWHCRRCSGLCRFACTVEGLWLSRLSKVDIAGGLQGLFLLAGLYGLGQVGAFPVNEGYNEDSKESVGDFLFQT